jgi:hypothetical protein
VNGLGKPVGRLLLSHRCRQRQLRSAAPTVQSIRLSWDVVIMKMATHTASIGIHTHRNPTQPASIGYFDANLDWARRRSRIACRDDPVRRGNLDVSAIRFI